MNASYEQTAIHFASIGMYAAAQVYATLALAEATRQKSSGIFLDDIVSELGFTREELSDDHDPSCNYRPETWHDWMDVDPAIPCRCSRSRRD